MSLLRADPNRDWERLRQVAVQARQPHDREAWLNLAFYLDEQYVTINDKTGSLQRIARPKGQENLPRPVVNKIMHFVQQERAMVLQAKPTVDVMPATDDLLDIGHASVAKSYTSFVADPTQANFNKQLSRATLWSIITGDGYLKWVWNPSEKRPDIIPVPRFELAIDPYATDFSKARYVIHSKFMDTEAVYETWGVRVKPNAVEKADEMKMSLLRGMGSAPVIEGVTIHELWHKKCKKYPEGLYTVWSGRETLVEAGPHPYSHKRIPFTQIGCIERPDSLYYMSPVKFMRSAQMELNKVHAQEIMIREAFANPKWWIPTDLELERLPDDSPRQILRGTGPPGVRPEIIQPSTFPQSGHAEMIETQMMHIVGLHEVSQAQVPGRVEAAKAIEMLKESDADRQSTMLDSITSSISEGFWQVLMLAKQYESNGRMLQAYSREGLPEIKRFRAEVVSEAMRVNTTMGTGLARSRAARQDQLAMLWDKQIITDPELMAELMEMPIPTFAAPKALDMKLARNENLELAKGVAIVPNSWDDHAIHLREHNGWRKTQEFLTSPEEVKQKFEHHCVTHETLQANALMKQAQLMALSQPPAPAGPAGPPGQSGDTATPPPA